MTEPPELSIYEKTFAKWDKTDAILVVDGKKLHVNKAVLSYHSDYFNKLFNSDSKEKTIEEFPIKGVNFENFATVLSLVHGAPINYTYDQAESLLEIADRFQLSAAKRHIELFILTHKIDEKNAKEHVLKWADKFKLNDLISHVVSLFSRETTFELSKNKEFLDKLSDETSDQLFCRLLVNNRRMSQYAVEDMRSRVNIYDKAFAKSDKTDAILVVGEEKLHVNKAVLSHNSDYFNALFNSEFKEKSMEEIPIEHVDFESFVTLLSFYHSNPIIPTKENAENILKLADRFQIPSTKFYMEPYMIHFHFSSLEAIRIGEKYQMDSLYESGFKRLGHEDFKNLLVQGFYEEFSADTKRKFFNSYLKFCKKPNYSPDYYGVLRNHMTETPDSSGYEETFVKTDKTDAILVVQGKKLHVNKALLSYHSDYFNTLFNSEFKEKSMEEIPIEDVNFEDFVTVLSLVHRAPIKYTYDQAESLLEIADRFLLPAAKRHIELFILTQSFYEQEVRKNVLRWADKFKLNDLINRVLPLFGFEPNFELSKMRDYFDELSNETIVKLFELMLVNDQQLDQDAVRLLQSRRPFVDVYDMRARVNIYDKAFAKFDKTDAILVVGEKKLHVNKAILSYHSDYFNTLFNSEFEEKSMEEIPIGDVDFESFVTLLSFYHSNPIIPTNYNAENILKLADRFLLPSTKFYMEPFMIHFRFSSLEAIRIVKTIMTETPELSTYEKTFAKSDKTDTILVVDGKKLHVNKAVLSYHSDYFNVMFNSEFKEKSMDEIPIEDVKFEDFAIVLSLVHSAPIKFSDKQEQLGSLLQIADRFQLPGVKRKLEQFILTLKLIRWDLIRVADKYGLEQAMICGLSKFIDKTYFRLNRKSCIGPNVSFFDTISKETRVRLFHRLLEVKGQIINVSPKPVESYASICESLFAKSDKTDAILVVDGKQLHVNKALLSYHSDYFKTLFNSDFKEKSMKEIEIKDVAFEDFATLLSFVHLNPITPKKENAEKILELADRFIIPCVKFFMEFFIIFFELDQLKEIRVGEKYGMTKNMTETSKISIYESTFSKSDKTDAVLMVNGKKLHVNKALLSYHSDYFKVLFNSEFKEQSMKEIEIKDVKFEEFATLLSLVQNNPILPDSENYENLLELADRFLLPAAKRHLELFIGFIDVEKEKKLQLADKYKLDALLVHALTFYNAKKCYQNMTEEAKNFSIQTKAKIFDDFFGNYEKTL
ncbi:unnamed protein product [Caenorhabditis brenneri]